MNKLKVLNCTDGYKTDHRSQYPEGTEMVYSNWTPRSLKYMAKTPRNDSKIVVFGLQYIIQSYLIDLWNDTFFNLPKELVVAQYKRRIDNYLGPDSITYDHVKDLHDLGYLPIRMRALNEGEIVDPKVAIYTIENTIPKFFWVTNFLETALSNLSWKMMTAASVARDYRDLLDYWAKYTCSSMEAVPFQGHDFSMRGMSTLEDSAMCGAAHLLSFVGTDAIPAIDLLEDYYGADCEKELIGCSVPASEHSVMSLSTRNEGEFNTFKRLITETYPTGIVSIVSDTFDFFKVVTEFLPELKNTVMKRDGKLVIRPDSGDPADIICGTCQDTMSPECTPQEKGAIQCLWETFGGTETENGYKLLDQHIGLIYGDSITLDRANDICFRLSQKGFASTNVVLGIGSFTYQYLTRDCCGFAIKATAGVINGEEVEIFKDPKTDDGTKKSAKGFLRVNKDEDNNYVMFDQQTREEAEGGALEDVFVDGKMVRMTTLSEVRGRMDANALYRYK